MIREVVIITMYIVAIFYPFSQFCETDSSLLSLQTQPNTAPNLFQRGVEYGKYAFGALVNSNSNINNNDNNTNNNNDSNDIIIIIIIG